MNSAARATKVLGGFVPLALLLCTPFARGWTHLPRELNADLCDVRVFDNFTDPTANDNLTPDPHFPGVTRAPLALWKAYAEWGSRPWVDGSGDPHQPGDLGSGTTNFDPVWLGFATDAGGLTDNVVSEISGSSGSILAFTEWGISQSGWRMRFYADAAVWDDGPDATLPAGRRDIQGVATHEFGHALGLGHSTVAGSTMVGSSAAPSIDLRSIAADDVLGLANKYFPLVPTRPAISAITLAPCTLVIQGSGFQTSGNEVWFTPRSPTGAHTPLRVLGVPSNGSTIQVAIPPDAGPGNVLVKVAGTETVALSNPCPIDPALVPPPANYCVAAANSFGPTGALMSSSGSTSLAANSFVISASAVPPLVGAAFHYGRNATDIPFGNGHQCVAAPSLRLGFARASSTGVATFRVDFSALPPAGAIAAGETWHFQLGYRNPAGGGAGFNASDGLRVTFCP